MILSKVIGSVVSTMKNRNFRGEKLMIVQPVDLELNPRGTAFIALDVVDAGIDDVVLVNKEGSGARLIFNNEEIPVQAVIVAVVDNLELLELEDNND